MRNLFVISLDDTLIDNAHANAEPLLDACSLIIRRLGRKAPHVSKIIALEHEIDSRRMKETNPKTRAPYLNSMERFPGSLVETYREICRNSGAPINPEVEIRLRAIGMRAFSERQYRENVNPHAAELITYLRRHGNYLVLCTEGDARTQSQKVAALREAGVPIHYFDEFLIVAAKSEKLFRTIRSGFSSLRSFYSIGSSYRSDIAPALAAGFQGIYIPVEAREPAKEISLILSHVDPAKYVVLHNLGDVIPWHKRVLCKNS